MADRLNVVDGTQSVVADDGVCGVYYQLAVRVDGLITRATAALLGPAVNALYGQALAALHADPFLGALAVDVHEGAEGGDASGLGLDLSLGREPHTTPAAGFGIHFALYYWQPQALGSRREPILSAFKNALDANAPGPGLCVREQVLSTFHAHLAATLAPLEVLRNAERPQRLAPGADLVVLLDGDQGVEHVTLGRTDYVALPTVEVFVAGGSSALDARLQQVRDAIRSAATVLRAGGIGEDVEEAEVDPEVLREAYTGTAMAAAVGARVSYATRELNPYEPA